MSPLGGLAAQWPAISELLDEALSLPQLEREDWLGTLAGQRAAHRDTVRALLRMHAQADTEDFLADLPRLPMAQPPAGDGPGADELVGPYRLLRELGAGGMGTVWLAERIDGMPRRRVALKLPRVAWGRAFTERLARERDILATLAHEHIARLLDAGIDPQGRPWIAMELVDGEPIDRHCRVHALTVDARIGLLLQAIAAMQHAHARLVIHRDLKPGNILVTPAGQVRLLDFGIAKLMEGDRTRETSLTELSGRALTLDYASPEQIRGEPLGTASDVYSLAVVAYELLAGTRPYRLPRRSAAALEEAIVSADPPLASEQAADPALQRRLRGDLDAILNKALKKDGNARYATMAAFADDLRRHLEQLPVRARPDRLGYRVRKFVRRHRLQAAAGAVAFAALVGGTGIALWQAREARQQAERARTEAATATAVQGFLESVFRANSGDQEDPDRARNTTARELLDQGAQRVDQALRDAPEARMRLLQTMAQMYSGMTLLDKAAELQRRRVDLALATWGERSAPAAQALADWSDTLAWLDRREGAVQAATRAATILDGLGDHGSSARYAVDLTLAMLYQRSDPARGVAAAQRAVANARARGATTDLVSALQRLGEIAGYGPDRALARDAVREAIGLVQADPAHGANHLSALYVALADAQSGLGESQAAEQSYRQAVRIAGERNGVAPIYLHTAQRRLGNFLRRNGRLRESLAVQRPAYEWARTNPAGFGAMSPTLVGEYGRVLVLYGDAEEGLVVLDEALAMQDGLREAPEAVHSLALFRTQALLDLGRVDEADAALAPAEAFFAGGAFAATAQIPRALRRQLQVARGEAGAALQAFEAARTAAGKPALPAAGESPRVLAESAWLRLEAGRPDEAAAQARAALAAIEAIEADPAQRGDLRDVEAQLTGVLGRALLRQRDAAGARVMLARSVALHRSVFDPARSLALADVLDALAQAQRAAGDGAGAAVALAEAQRIRGTHPRFVPRGPSRAG